MASREVVTGFGLTNPPADNLVAPTGALSLPTELIEMTAALMDDASLLAFRLASKDLMMSTQRIVATRFFTDRSFLFFHRPSMDVLRQISEHPVLSKAMKIIRLSPAMLHDSEIDSSLRLKSVPGQSRADRFRRRQHQHAYEEIIRTTQHFVGTKGCRKLLAIALQNFGTHGSVLKICMKDHELHGPEKPSSYRRCAEAVGHEKPFREYPDTWLSTDDPYKIVAEAISDAKFRPRELRLGYFGCPATASSLEPISNPNAPCLEDLVSLELYLMPSIGLVDRRSSALKDILLNPAMRLKHLAVSFNQYWDRDRIMDQVMPEAKDGALMCLESLQLQGNQLRLDNLLRFVHTRRSTLLRIWLRRCYDGSLQCLGSVADDIIAQFSEELSADSSQRQPREAPDIAVISSWEGDRW